MAGMRPIARLCCGLFLLAALAPWAASPACDASAAREKARLDRVGKRLDITLADGRLIFFPSVEPPRATPAAPKRPAEVASELTSLLRDKALLVLALGGADRWGRIPARLFVEGESELADEALAAAGLVMASSDAGPCGAGVKAAEAEARAARLGGPIPPSPCCRRTTRLFFRRAREPSSLSRAQFAQSATAPGGPISISRGGAAAFRWWWRGAISPPSNAPAFPTRPL